MSYTVLTTLFRFAGSAAVIFSKGLLSSVTCVLLGPGSGVPEGRLGQQCR